MVIYKGLMMSYLAAELEEPASDALDFWSLSLLL